MGISSKKSVYDFKRKFHSIVSNEENNLPLVDIIAYLNEGQEIWYENRVYVAQTNQKVRNDLRVFKKDKIPLNCEILDKKCCLARYPKNIYKRLNQLAITTKACCPDIEKEIIPRILQSDDLHEARKNPYRQANFFYEQLNAIETKDGLIIYHDGEMEIKSIFIDYYRKPKEIHAPSLEICDDGVYYDYCGRIIKRDSNFEVDATYAHNDVVNIAVLLASRDIGNITGFQLKLAEILQTQTLYKTN